MKDIENRLRRALRLGGAISSTLVKAALEWVVQAKHMHGIPDDWIVTDRSGESVQDISEEYVKVLKLTELCNKNLVQLRASEAALKTRLLGAIPKTDAAQMIPVGDKCLVVFGYWMSTDNYHRSVQLIQNVVKE